MTIDDILLDESAIFELDAGRAADVLPELAAALARQTGLAEGDLLAGMREREQLGSTAIGHGLALPHTKAEVGQSRGVLGIARRGIEFGAPDREPVVVFLALVSPTPPSEHLRALACVSRAFKDPTMIEQVLGARDAAEILALLRRQGTGGSA